MCRGYVVVVVDGGVVVGVVGDAGGGGGVLVITDWILTADSVFLPAQRLSDYQDPHK